MAWKSTASLSVLFSLLVVLFGCEKTGSLGLAKTDAAAGGASSGGSTGLGGTGLGGSKGSGGVGGKGGAMGAGGVSGYGGYIITATGPDSLGGAGGSTGAGGSSASDAAVAYAELCTSTRGSVASELCCTSALDFPGSCGVGACSCSPTNSKMISTCVCPNGTCFDRTAGCRPLDDGGF